MQKLKQILLSQHPGGVNTEDARGTSCEHVLYHIPSLSLSSLMCSCCGDRDQQILQPIICVLMANAHGYVTLLKIRGVYVSGCNNTNGV
jgi:hypothetical protein